MNPSRWYRVWDVSMLILVKLLFSAIGAIICLIPLWLYLFSKWLFNPLGFWQNLILAGVGVYFLWFIQLILAGVLLFVLGVIWLEKPENMAP